MGSVVQTLVGVSVTLLLSIGPEANAAPIYVDDSAAAGGNPNLTPPACEADLDREPRRQDGNLDGVSVTDMGADEFAILVLGDLDCDGVLDFADINPFVLALSDPVAYCATYPNCTVWQADGSGDGHVDFGDIDPFVELLAGP